MSSSSQPWTQLVLFVYDITSDSTRNKVHKLLSRYGVPVQKSAFEARLERGEKQYLLDELKRLINPEVDSIHVYPIPKDVEPKIVELGKPRPPVVVEDYFILE